MRKHLKYLRYLVFHKYWVLTEGWKRGLRLRVIIHDWDKFFPSRWNAYADNFAVKEPSEEVKDRFRVSWRKHVFMNDHHWQFWISIHDDGKMRTHEMSEKARIEMLVDWISAHRATADPGIGNLSTWYRQRAIDDLLAPKTRRWIEKELSKL